MNNSAAHPPGTFQVPLSGFGKLLAVAPEEELKGEPAKHKHSSL